MALYVPKMVVLQNDLLARCYSMLYLLTAGAMLGWFFLSGGHLLPVSLRGFTTINMWINAPSDEALNDTMLAHQGDVCGSPSDYDYWWSEQWQYNGSRCVEVSSTCRSHNGTCLRTADMHVKESPRELFLVTWTETSGDVTEEPTRFYVPQATAFSLSFHYAFTVPHSPWLQMNRLVSRPPVDEEHRLSNKEVMTVFLDAQRDIAWVAKPDEPLELPVPALLQLAGYADHLTTPSPEWGENVFPGARYPEGPIGMIGGLPLEILVHCHKTPKKELGEGYAYWTGPTCYVIANAHEIWSERHASDNLGQQGMQYTYQAGIRITGEMDGTWEYFDVNNCILSFTALLVLLELPKTVMVWVSCRALGHLSKIYRAVVFHKFYIEEHIAATAARILTHSASLREIEHADDHGGLSSQGLHDAIRYAAQPRPASDVVVETRSGKTVQADEDNVLCFSDFAFNAICHPSYRSTHDRVTRFLQKVLGDRLMAAAELLMWCLLGEDYVVDDVQADGEAPRISVDQFISTVVSSGQVRFDHLLLLFNKNRRPSPLERWFTPSFVSEYLKRKHQELSASEKLRTLRSQEARAEESKGGGGEVGLSMDGFKLSNRFLIKQLNEDLHHVRGSNGRPATTADCRYSISEEGLLADCFSSDPTPTRAPRLAPGEALAPSTSTVANHARPPGPEEGAVDRAEVTVSEIELLAGWRAGHQAAAQRHTATDHARPPGQEEGGRAGIAAAACSGPQRPGAVAWSLGVHPGGSERVLREQSPNERDGGGSPPRPVLRPGQPLGDGAAGAAGAEAAADGTRQPSGQEERTSRTARQPLATPRLPWSRDHNQDCTPATGDNQGSGVFGCSQPGRPEHVRC